MSMRISARTPVPAPASVSAPDAGCESERASGRESGQMLGRWLIGERVSRSWMLDLSPNPFSGPGLPARDFPRLTAPARSPPQPHVRLDPSLPPLDALHAFWLGIGVIV